MRAGSGGHISRPRTHKINHAPLFCRRLPSVAVSLPVAPAELTNERTLVLHRFDDDTALVPVAHVNCAKQIACRGDVQALLLKLVLAEKHARREEVIANLIALAGNANLSSNSRVRQHLSVRIRAALIDESLTSENVAVLGRVQ